VVATSTAVTVTATSVADPSKTASAKVTVRTTRGHRHKR
jgi:hypothetical protein